MNTKTLLTLAVTGLLATALVVPAAAATYEIDTAHSSVAFSIRHMAISKTKGTFDDFSGSFTYDPDKPKSWQCEAVIQAKSINTGNEQRDDHLRNPDFFDVATYPTITFESTAVHLNGDGKGTLKGNLTMHGVTKEIELDLELVGLLPNSPFGDSRAGFTATGKLDRKDFGLSWNRAMETGGLVVGNEVEITLEVEGIAK